MNPGRCNRLVASLVVVLSVGGARADVATAVVFRSAVTALAVGTLLVLQGVPLKLAAKHRRALPAIGALIAVMSDGTEIRIGRTYSAMARAQLMPG